MSLNRTPNPEAQKRMTDTQAAWAVLNQNPAAKRRAKLLTLRCQACKQATVRVYLWDISTQTYLIEFCHRTDSHEYARARNAGIVLLERKSVWAGRGGYPTTCKCTPGFRTKQPDDYRHQSITLEAVLAHLDAGERGNVYVTP